MNLLLFCLFVLLSVLLVRFCLARMPEPSQGCKWFFTQDFAGYVCWEALQTGIYRPLANRGVVHESAQGVWYWGVYCGWGPCLERGQAASEHEALQLVNKHIQD